MEAILAACLGWISTEDELIDIRTGLRIRNASDDTVRAEVIYPNGDLEEFEGAAADAIFDRAEWMAETATKLIAQLDAAARVATGEAK